MYVCVGVYTGVYVGNNLNDSAKWKRQVLNSWCRGEFLAVSSLSGGFLSRTLSTAFSIVSILLG